VPLLSLAVFYWSLFLKGFLTGCVAGVSRGAKGGAFTIASIIMRRHRAVFQHSFEFLASRTPFPLPDLGASHDAPAATSIRD
jgi:hypothetical protein